MIEQILTFAFRQMQNTRPKYQSRATCADRTRAAAKLFSFPISGVNSEAHNETVQPSRMKHILYFDLETQRSAQEVGGWDKISNMGMSVGVVYSTVTNGYKIYSEREVDQLIKDLQRADLI